MKAPGGPKIALYEYQSYSTSEFPDVLIFYYGKTQLYEIKTSYTDFKADKKKQCRKKYVPQRWWGYYSNKGHKISPPDIYMIQAPHLGSFRYYVCESEVIPIEEVPEGWGLYYVKGNKFNLIKESMSWRANIYAEKDILAHAFRKYASGDTTGIIVNTYK